jgi:restriction system protein
MMIPDYQTLMLPLLRLTGDQAEHSLPKAVEALAAQFHLTDEDRAALLPSGQQPIFHNRVGWARTYMKKAGLLESPRRGRFKITPRGLEVLRDPPERINNAFLNQYAEFLEFRTRQDSPSEDEKPETQEVSTPEESIENAYAQIREALGSELISKVKSCSPGFFERLVVDLLLNMGYGGSRTDAGRAIGKSGDGGIDGIINEDRLGLDVVYIQAKRWEAAVGRPEIQKFVGALQGHRARKGVFITTSAFTKEAEDYASRVDSKIVLINGAQLARLMMDFGVGVTSQTKYEVMRMDSDYFAEE